MQILIDEQDQWLLDAYNWYSEGRYAVYELDGMKIRLHHCIVGMPIDPDIVIDHINRVKWDNRRANIRYATRSENYLNSDWSDKAKYIYRQTNSGNYYVEITHERTRYYGGTYKT